MRISKEFTREALYEDVWTEPAFKLAAKHGISPATVAKICRKLAIPMPPRSYWPRMKRGLPVQRKPLPAAKAGAPVVHRIDRWVEDRAEVGEVAPEARALAAREREPEQKVIVAAMLTDPHPLVAATEPVLRRAAAKAKGMLPNPAQKHRVLDIDVTEPLIERALRVADALVKALEARGYQVEVGNSEVPRAIRRTSARGPASTRPASVSAKRSSHSASSRTPMPTECRGRRGQSKRSTA